MDARQAYLDAIVTAAEEAAGRPLGGGTLACPDPDRVGRRSATSYPTPAGTVIWCDPALIDQIALLLADEGGTAITTGRWVELAVAAGAEHAGSGNNRVLIGEIDRPSNGDGRFAARRLDRHVESDVETLRSFVIGIDQDDLDEAELDLDELDPFIVGLFDGDEMVAYASSIPADEMPEFDDIAVLTHPQHRRRGLGALAVAEFVAHRTRADPTRRMLYRCDVDNTGSNGVAEALGFDFVHTIGAVRFPE